MICDVGKQSKPMRIALRTSAIRNQIYREIGSRFSCVFCTDMESSEGVITNDVPLSLAAAAAGKHVLFDAPTEISGTKCGALAAAGAANGAVTMPGHEWRFIPTVAAVNSSLEAGNLGEPGLLRIHRWRADTGDEVDRAMLMADLDLARWMFGQDPAAIYVVRRTTYVQVHLGFENDGMAMIAHATGRPANTHYDSLTLIGSSGAAYADDHHNMNLHFTEKAPTAIKVSQGNTHTIGMVSEFLTAIAESRPPFVTLEETQGTLKMLEKVSNAEGRLL